MKMKAQFIAFSLFQLLQIYLARGDEEVDLLIDVGNGFWANNLVRDWGDSKRYCEQEGMTIASHLTEADVIVLRAAYNETNFAGTHWIGARNSQTAKALAWDSDDGTVTQQTTEWVYDMSNYLLCGAYYSAKDGPLYRLLSCQLQYKVLCKQNQG